MDRSKRSLLVSSPVATKPDSPRLRRKLQKGGARQRNLSKRPGSGASNEASADDKSHNANKQSLPLPPDLSDSKWSEYLRGREYLCVLDSSVRSTESLVTPNSIIPGLTHPNNTKHEKGRPSIEKLCSASPTPSRSSEMRRRAKTPVFSIGQLEAAASTTGRAASGPDKTSSVELIAEQYRALLESRNSMFTDCHSEPPPSRQEDRGELEIRRQHSSDDLQGSAAQLPQPTAEPPTGSPTSSDDGTLVAFEEETVYFKPVSFSPEPLSPIHNNNYEQPFVSPSFSPESLSLQICVDLLTRDLTSAIITDRPRRCASDSSALQVWVMIEAYERLRDRILDSRLRYDGEVQSVELMFDMWLRALYDIHDSLTGEGRTTEGEYEELELSAEELD
ncbi:hypothetical protein QBC33DRAFT_165383 [Phialemonium atrogriseum]|uniref:Mating-type switching protein swi10 n=1 Tax=Phialemonium atrogriseum TaxID=1093897 RepID=A0AAJ0CAP9_9PEZI|nr:uncharacterized protein QBC33DRAFT_165383 [Phialemonium atrogriseum]KAK1771754.1 hypothetical protein QBC33DRAFT_165383 [Phialemonium atrogriseum]